MDNNLIELGNHAAVLYMNLEKNTQRVSGSQLTNKSAEQFAVELGKLFVAHGYLAPEVEDDWLRKEEEVEGNWLLD